MPLPVVYGRRVGPSLANAYGWYEAQRAGLGEEFLAAADASFDAIEMYPQISEILAPLAQPGSLTQAASRRVTANQAAKLKRVQV